MADFNYAALRDSVVQPLLRDFDEAKTGKLVVAGVTTGPGYDPQPAADVEHPVTVVKGAFSKEDMAGGLVQQDDLMFLVSPEGLTITPEMPYRIIAGGVEYQIVRIQTIQPGSGTTLLWKVHARK